MTSRVETTLSLSALEKRDLLQVLGDVDSDTRDVFGLALTDAQWASIPAIVNAVAYQGFDPYKVISEFMTKAKSAPSDTYRTVEVGNIKMSVCEGTNARTDLSFFLALFLTRGNNVPKILLKCDSAVKDTISRKCVQYGIAVTAQTSKTPLGPSVITLARLSQAFAPATAAVILGHSLFGNLKSKLFPGVVLPILMTHTIFPALLREEDAELIEIAKYLNLEMSIMLSAPKEKRRMTMMTLSDLLEQSDSFVMAAVNGSISASTVKAKALIKSNIIEENGAKTPIVATMVSMCGMLHSLIGESYSSAAKRMSALTTPAPQVQAALN